MSKKLATIITNVPVQFHEEDYKLSENNIPALTEIFNLLEFKTLGKRILGSDFEEKTRTASDEKKKIDNDEVQTDLFGNEVKAKKATVKTKTIVLDSETGTQSVLEPNDEPGNTGYDDDEAESDLPKLIANKNIENTPHEYEMIVGDQAIEDFIKKISTKQTIK